MAQKIQAPFRGFPYTQILPKKPNGFAVSYIYTRAPARTRINPS